MIKGRPQNMVCVGIGQCGVQTLDRVWHMLMTEHKLNYLGEMIEPAQNENTSIMTHFLEHSHGRYSPRTL